MSPKQILLVQRLILEQTWPNDCCLCTYELAIADLERQLAEAQGKLERYERFLGELRAVTYRAPELFPTNEVATYAHQLGVVADRILSKEGD